MSGRLQITAKRQLTTDGFRNGPAHTVFLRMNFSAFPVLYMALSVFPKAIAAMQSASPRFFPVKLVLPGAGEALTIESVHDAADALLHDWPEKTGQHYMLALQACIDAIMDRTSNELARKAFISAAEKAGILVII